MWIATTYCGPKSRTARGRGREGAGAYPELAALGIRKGATPALQSQVGRLTALLPLIELARDELRRQGPTLDEKAVHRISHQLGAEILATRTRDLQRFRDGLLPAGQEMAGQHVVAQVDGGRVRIRTRIETTKRKGVKHRRKIRVEWREPKLLILYLSDRKGRMLKGTRPWIDGTLNGPDHTMELLAFHLHRLGAARAQAVSFVSDGAPWIWNRLDWVIGRAGLDPKRVERVLDCCHAVHHVSLALQALGLEEAERTATYRTLRHQLRGSQPGGGGHASQDGAGAALRLGGVGRDRFPGQTRGPPALRLVRLPGATPGQRRGRERDPPGDQPAAEGQRDLLEGGECRRDAGVRAAVLTGRWQETMEKVQKAMASDRRRDWQWEAPDIVGELNSAVPIRPPTPQHQSAEQNETIAA